MKKDITIPDLSGCLAVVTGANSGIGFGLTKRLAGAGAEVIMAVRNYDKGIKAIEDIQKENREALLSIQLVDLSILQSVKEFAERLIASGRPINYLINNAGLMSPPARVETREGFELHFAANYLGHFALTARLIALLRMANPSRVTMISSSTNHFGRVHFEDLQLVTRYNSDRAYAQSKLAMLMFAMELNTRSQHGGWGIVSNAAHPGATITNIQSRGRHPEPGKAATPLLHRLGKMIPGIWQGIDQGCLPTLFATTSAEAMGGAYYGPDGFFELNGFPKLAKIPAEAKKEEDLKRLWKISEQLAQVRFPEPGGSDVIPYKG